MDATLRSTWVCHLTRSLGGQDLPTPLLMSKRGDDLTERSNWRAFILKSRFPPVSASLAHIAFTRVPFRSARVPLRARPAFASSARHIRKSWPPSADIGNPICVAASDDSHFGGGRDAFGGSFFRPTFRFWPPGARRDLWRGSRSKLTARGG